MDDQSAPSCGLPFARPERVLMAHGGGGRMMQQLIAEVFEKALAPQGLHIDHDSAVFAPPPGRLAFTTDSYVVRPRFFPGGDIGKLAVIGTVNDLAMSGARPLALSLSVILEEGLALAELERIVASVAAAARECEVAVLTGDTKVVERGNRAGGQIFLKGQVRKGIHALITGHPNPAALFDQCYKLAGQPVSFDGVAINTERGQNLGLEPG